MTILTQFFVLAFSFLFLTFSSIVYAFGDYYDWYNYRDYPPTLHTPVSVPVAVPEPVEIKPHRKISITTPMSGVIRMLNYYQKGDLIAAGTVLFILEAMKMELSVVAPYFKGDTSKSNKKGYIRVTDACKKVSLNSYVECDDLIFIFSEDKEEDTQELSFYNDKNDDDNNKSPPSLPSETLSDNTRNISLPDQPSARALAHDLEDSSSEQTSNLEEKLQISYSENTSLSLSSEKIPSKTLETTHDVLRFSNQRILNYGVLFFESSFSLSFKNIINHGLYCPLNFSKIKSFMNSREEQTNVLSLFKPQYMLSPPNVKHSQSKESLFLKKDAHREETLLFTPPKGSNFQKIEFFQDHLFNQKKEVLLWNLMAVYGILSFVFFFKKRRMSPELLMIYLFEEVFLRCIRNVVASFPLIKRPFHPKKIF